MDLILSTSAVKDTLVALEVVKDDNNDGLGLTVHHQHGQYGLTFRWDSVDNTPSKLESTSTTLALSCEMWDPVETILEWKTFDSGVKDSKTEDMLTLAWIAEF